MSRPNVMNLSQPQDELSAVLSNFWAEMFHKVSADVIPLLLEQIKAWAGDQPDLTSALCDYVIQYTPHQLAADDAAATVDRIVKKEVIENWDNSIASPHLNLVRRTLLNYNPRDSLLILYIRILQRGEVPITQNDPEQAVLLATGIVQKTPQGKLKIANGLYPKIFNVNWVEQQVPGITKPVTIISQPKTPMVSSGLFPKAAVVVCSLAVMAFAIAANYRKAPEVQALAREESLADDSSASVQVSGAADYITDGPPNILVDSNKKVDSSEAASDNAGSTEADSDNADSTEADSDKANLDRPDLSKAEPIKTVSRTTSDRQDRQLFDGGTTHAQNSRWVPMMRDFCKISGNSAYSAPAARRLEQWVTLYPEDIKIAHDIVAQETGESCAIADKALSN
jgi:hypothetical protein